MALKAKVSRMQSIIDPTTGNVVKWVIGFTVTDTGTGESSYRDAEVPVPEADQKPFNEWTNDEARQFAYDWGTKRETDAEGNVTKENWIVDLAGQVEAQAGRPKHGESLSV